jgi:dihydroceramidase
VDFCESNYALSLFIAEPANTLSSFVIVIQGLVGMWHSHRHEVKLQRTTSKWIGVMFSSMYLMLTLVGLGSVLLHASLISFSQAADEVPMMLLSIVMISVLLEIDCKGPELRFSWVPLAATLSAVAVVAIYFIFQQSYTVFLVMYLATVVVIVVWTGKLALVARNSQIYDEIRKK